MESEGPYKHLLNYLPIDGVVRCALVCPACVYAEGRKAAEMEFKELLDLANQFDAEAPYKDPTSFEFGAWKKARGIE